MPYRKVYTVEIENCHTKPGIWYAGKIGERYDCKLGILHPRVVVFVVLEVVARHIYPVHCKVVAERIDEYEKGK